jgi:NOL1/NOP2/sun family putative RNA methylase
MKLPPAFVESMERQLGEEAAAFLQTYEEKPVTGLRANSRKISPDTLKERLPYLHETVPWASDGFYYDESQVRPAKHPYYYAGLYYLQEPSAMLPAELLSVQPGERVLDLCAAPGGKSVQLAARLGQLGLLVANDIHPQRARVLLKNLERYGVTNVVVVNESPERLADVFPGYFDRILVDAPCSGEGMFRKEPEMMKDWSREEVAKYVQWQEAILDQVPKLLRPGGTVVYSTCTFSIEENEGQVQRFVERHPEFVLETSKRLWPHRVKGEGHFAAKLHVPARENAEDGPIGSKPDPRVRSSLTGGTTRLLEEFAEQVWGDPQCFFDFLPQSGQVVERQGHILWEHADVPSLRGLRVLRSGWLLGTVEKGRFRPSQAFAMGLPFDAVKEARQICDFRTDDESGLAQAVRYLRGETIQVEGHTWEKGWHLVAVDGYPLGWAKGAGSSLKNEYPPGWRWEDGGVRIG